MEPRLLIKVLPRIPQVERDFRDAGRPRRRHGHLTRKPLGRRGRLLIPKRTVRPLPHRLSIGLGEFSGGVQVVAVHGIGLAVDTAAMGMGPLAVGSHRYCALPEVAALPSPYSASRLPSSAYT